MVKRKNQLNIYMIMYLIFLDSKSQNTTQDIQRLDLKIREILLLIYLQKFCSILSFLEKDTVFNNSLFIVNNKEGYFKNKNSTKRK